MPSQQIQWFPGHMAKTRRLISENLKSVDIVIVLLDSRIPLSSQNPEIASLTEGKPTLTLLNKTSLADPEITAMWLKHFKLHGMPAHGIDCITGDGLGAIGPAVRGILAERIKHFEDKGMTGRKIRAMILGIPNVGKSSLVNKLCGRKKAQVENRPGVTLTKQWVATNAGFDLLDMPGVLWPKFEDRTTGENLAATGAIKDAVIDTEELGMILSYRLLRCAPELFCSRYKLDYNLVIELDPYDLLCAIGKARGFLVSGGEINTERTALTVLDEFRSARIGRISLESPCSSEVPNA